MDLMEMRLRQHPQYWSNDYIPEKKIDCPVVSPASTPIGWNKKHRTRRDRQNVVQGFEMISPSRAARLENEQKCWLSSLPWSYADAVKKPNNKQSNQAVSKEEDLAEGSSESSDQENISVEAAELNDEPNTNGETSDGDSQLNPDASEFVPGATSSEKDEMTTSVTISTSDDDNNVQDISEHCNSNQSDETEAKQSEQHETITTADVKECNQSEQLNEINGNIHAENGCEQEAMNDFKENNSLTAYQTEMSNSEEDNLVYFEQEQANEQQKKRDPFDPIISNDDQERDDQTPNGEFDVIDNFATLSTFEEFKNKEEKDETENDRIISFGNELNFEELVKNKTHYSEAYFKNDECESSSLSNSFEEQKQNHNECNEDDQSSIFIENRDTNEDSTLGNDQYANDTNESLDNKENEDVEKFEQNKIINDENIVELQPEEIMESTTFIEETKHSQNLCDAIVNKDQEYGKEILNFNPDLQSNTLENILEDREMSFESEENQMEKDEVEKPSMNTGEENNISMNENFFSEGNNVNTQNFSNENFEKCYSEENDISKMEFENNPLGSGDVEIMDNSLDFNTELKGEHNKENIDSDIQNASQLNENSNTFDNEVRNLSQDIMTLSMYESQDNDSSFEIIYDSLEKNETHEEEQNSLVDNSPSNKMLEFTEDLKTDSHLNNLHQNQQFTDVSHQNITDISELKEANEDTTQFEKDLSYFEIANIKPTEDEKNDHHHSQPFTDVHQQNMTDIGEIKLADEDTTQFEKVSSHFESGDIESTEDETNDHHQSQSFTEVHQQNMTDISEIKLADEDTTPFEKASSNCESGDIKSTEDETNDHHQSKPFTEVSQQNMTDISELKMTDEDTTQYEKVSHNFESEDIKSAGDETNDHHQSQSFTEVHQQNMTDISEIKLADEEATQFEKASSNFESREMKSAEDETNDYNQSQPFTDVSQQNMTDISELKIIDEDTTQFEKISNNFGSEDIKSTKDVNNYNEDDQHTSVDEISYENTSESYDLEMNEEEAHIIEKNSKDEFIEDEESQKEDHTSLDEAETVTNQTVEKVNHKITDESCTFDMNYDELHSNGVDSNEITAEVKDYQELEQINHETIYEVDECLSFNEDTISEREVVCGPIKESRTSEDNMTEESVKDEIPTIEGTQMAENELFEKIIIKDNQYKLLEEDSNEETSEDHKFQESEESHIKKETFAEMTEAKELQIQEDKLFEKTSEVQNNVEEIINELHTTEICEAQEIEEETQFNEEVSPGQNTEPTEISQYENEVPVKESINGFDVECDKTEQSEELLLTQMNEVYNEQITNKITNNKELDILITDEFQSKEDIIEEIIQSKEDIIEEIITNTHENKMTEISTENSELQENEFTIEKNFHGVTPELQLTKVEAEDGDTAKLNEVTTEIDEHIIVNGNLQTESPLTTKVPVTDGTSTPDDSSLLEVGAIALSAAAITSGAVGAAVAVKTMETSKEPDTLLQKEKRKSAINTSTDELVSKDSSKLVESKEPMTEIKKSGKNTTPSKASSVKPSSPLSGKPKTPLAAKHTAATSKTPVKPSSPTPTKASASPLKASTGASKPVPSKPVSAAKPLPSAKPLNSTKSSATTAKPSAATAKPSAATPKPSAATTKPTATTAKPNAAASKPAPASAKPVAATKPPAITKPTPGSKPATAAKSTVAAKPGTPIKSASVTAAKPAAALTTSKPAAKTTAATKPSAPMPIKSTPTKPGSPTSKPGTPTNKSAAGIKPIANKPTTAATKPAASTKPGATPTKVVANLSKSAPSKPGLAAAKSTTDKSSEVRSPISKASSTAKPTTPPAKSSPSKPTAATTKATLQAKKPGTPPKQSVISSTATRPTSSANPENSPTSKTNGPTPSKPANKVTPKAGTPAKTSVSKQGADSPALKSKAVSNKPLPKSQTPVKKSSTTSDKNAKNSIKSVNTEKEPLSKNGDIMEEIEPVTSTTTGDLLPIENGSLIEELPPQLTV